MSLLRSFKNLPRLIAYVFSGDAFEPLDDEGASARSRAAAWMRWILEKENLPEEHPPPGAPPLTRGIWFLERETLLPEEDPPANQPAPTRGIWFLEPEPFPGDLPPYRPTPTFWSWLLRPDKDDRRE